MNRTILNRWRLSPKDLALRMGPLVASLCIASAGYAAALYQTCDPSTAVLPSDGYVGTLRNVWSGKYLTVVDAGDYASILSQKLNPLWASQRWTIVN